MHINVFGKAGQGMWEFILCIQTMWHVGPHKEVFYDMRYSTTRRVFVTEARIGTGESVLPSGKAVGW